jgi:hypothetical protein
VEDQVRGEESEEDAGGKIVGFAEQRMAAAKPRNSLANAFVELEGDERFLRVWARCGLTHGKLTAVQDMIDL